MKRVLAILMTLTVLASSATMAFADEKVKPIDDRSIGIIIMIDPPHEE